MGTANRGLLLIGESGAGKSTVTLQCALAGLDFLSEDSVLVAPRTLLATAVSNFAHLCHDGLNFLPAGVARMLARFPTIRRRSGAAKVEIDLRDTVFRLAEPPLRLVGTVFLSAASARTGPMLLPLSGREMAVRLRATQPYAASQRGWGLFSRLLSRRPAFELRRGKHPAESAEVVTRLLSARKLQPQAVSAM